MSPPPLKTSAFTLVELLVVMAIIGVLAALGLSVAGEGRKRSEATKCLSTLRQMGVALRAYVNDHDGRLPDTGHVRAADGSSLSWIYTLARYLGPDFIGRCPAHAEARAAVTYGWNDLLVETTGEGFPAVRCAQPSATLAVAEIADNASSEHFHFAGARSKVTYNQFKADVGIERHGSGANYLFVDGHVEILSPAEIKTRLSAPDSAFLIP